MALQPKCFVFLASLGKDLGGFFLVWPYFQFLAFSEGSNIPKIPKSEIFTLSNQANGCLMALQPK